MGMILGRVRDPGRRPGPRRCQGGLGDVEGPVLLGEEGLADGACAGQLVDWVAGAASRPTAWIPEIVKRSDEAVGFEVIAEALDRGADVGLAQPLSASEQRLRGDHPQSPRP